MDLISSGSPTMDGSMSGRSWEERFVSKVFYHIIFMFSYTTGREYRREYRTR